MCLSSFETFSARNSQLLVIFRFLDLLIVDAASGWVDSRFVLSECAAIVSTKKG